MILSIAYHVDNNTKEYHTEFKPTKYEENNCDDEHCADDVLLRHEQCCGKG